MLLLGEESYILKAGFAERKITPPDNKCFITGYSSGVAATGVHDDLYTVAICFEDGERRAALVSLDLIGYRQHVYSRLKSEISKVAEIDYEAIFLTCTHTHAGPNTRKFLKDKENPEYSEAYTDFLVSQVAEAVKEAASSMREFNLGINRAYVDENMNRRLFLNDEYRYPSRYVDLAPIAHAYGQADKELGLVYFYPKEGEYDLFPIVGKGDWHPFGVISNYTMHPIVAGRVSNLISADVPGVVRNLVRESLGCPLCYITGAAGDNHPRRPNTGFEEMRRVGAVLASAAIQRCSDALMIEEPIKMKHATHSLVLNYISVEEYCSIPANMKPTSMQNHLFEPGGPVSVEYTLLSIGPVLFVGVPGELVSELGSVLKWFSPYQRTYIMYNATPNLGYISHPNAYKLGGYEPLKTELSPGSVKRLIQHMLSSMEDMYAS
jgi:neutral ceramidase